MSAPPAPGDLRIVQEFVNTADRAAGTDILANSRALADWLAMHRLLPAGTELDTADLERAVVVREGWYKLFAGPAGRESVEALDLEASTALLRARFAADGEIRFEPAAPGFDEALARLLVIAARAQRDGQWLAAMLGISPSP